MLDIFAQIALLHSQRISTIIFSKKFASIMVSTTASGRNITNMLCILQQAFFMFDWLMHTQSTLNVHSSSSLCIPEVSSTNLPVFHLEVEYK